MSERESHYELDIRSNLERQFDNPERVEVKNSVVEIHDLIPPELKTEVPTILMPGWSSTGQVLRENIISLAEHGRRVIVASAPHGIESEPHPLYPQIEMRKAEAVLETLRYKNIPIADAVGHSEAGVFLGLAASEDSKRFRNLVLVSPAGLIGPDSLPRLAKGFNEDISRQWGHGALRDWEHGKKSWQAIQVALQSWMEDPRRTWEAIMSMVKTEIPGVLKKLKADGHGITIIHGAHDHAFPMDRMAGKIKAGKTSSGTVTSEMVDGFISVRGSHNELYLQPHPLTELIDQQLDALEKKYPTT